MRLTCLQENLSRGLSVVGRAVASRTTLPIAQNVLLSIDEGRLKLTATDLELAISTWVGVTIEEEGQVTVPARLLADFVGSLPSKPIDIESTDKPVGLSLRCDPFKGSISGAAAEDFPAIPGVDSGLVGSIEVGVLKEAIEHVAFAAATADSRPVLTGVKIEMGGDRFTFAAADGFRLAVYRGKLAQPVPDDVEFILPARALGEINALASDHSSPIEFTVAQSRSNALFRLNEIELVCQLVQGNFPNYTPLIPKDSESTIKVDQEEFLRAARTAAIFARDGSGIIRLMVEGDDRLKVWSQDGEAGMGEGSIPATVTSGGSDMKIAFDHRYLTSVVEALGSGRVVMETKSPSSPGLLRPVDREGYEDDYYEHVVMPMFVQW